MQFRTAVSRIRAFLLLIAVVGSYACGDRTTLVEPKSPPPSTGGPRRTVVYPAPVLGPVPGRNTITLGFANQTTARDSAVWPDSFPVNTRVKLTVAGRIERKYNPNIWLSLNLANKPYPSIDADGEFLSSQCWAHIYTSFRISPTAFGSNISACRASSANTPIADGATAYEVIGVVRGAGFVGRWTFGQPSYPAMQYCGASPAPCVWALQGSQTITIEPTALKLSLKATPDTILSGDVVFFQPSAEGGLAYSVRSWIWVPDESPLPPVLADIPVASVTSNDHGLFRDSPRPIIPVPSIWEREGAHFGATPLTNVTSNLDPRTVYCPATASTCRIPVFQSGVM